MRGDERAAPRNKSLAQRERKLGKVVPPIAEQEFSLNPNCAPPIDDFDQTVIKEVRPHGFPVFNVIRASVI